MKQYKEIRQWTYLDLQSGDVFFNEVNVLSIVNNSPMDVYYAPAEENGISLEGLYKLCEKANINFLNIPSKDILFAKNWEDKIIDLRSSMSNKTKVLSSINLKDLLNYVSSIRGPVQSSKEKSYTMRAWGEISRYSDNEFFISLKKCMYDIEGFGSFNGIQHNSSEPTPLPSIESFSSKAKELLKTNDRFKLIKVSPQDINFNNRNLRSSNVETFVNISLHDELFNFYSRKDFSGNQHRIKSIQDIIKNLHTPYDYASEKFAEGSITKAQNFQMSKEDIEAFNAYVRRIINTVASSAQKQIDDAIKSETHYFCNMKNAEHWLGLIFDELQTEKWESHIDPFFRQILINYANQY